MFSIIGAEKHSTSGSDKEISALELLFETNIMANSNFDQIISRFNRTQCKLCILNTLVSKRTLPKYPVGNCHTKCITFIKIPTRNKFNDRKHESYLDKCRNCFTGKQTYKLWTFKDRLKMGTSMPKGSIGCMQKTIGTRMGQLIDHG